MADTKELDELLISGKMSIVDYAYTIIEGQYSRAKAKDADYLWTLEVQMRVWSMVKNCHAEGKKLVWFGGSVPTEIIWAFDCVPFYLDTVPLRLSSMQAGAARFIDAAQKYCPSSMCALDATELGLTLLDQFGVKPDAFVYQSVPCDSSRLAFPNMERILGCPTFTFDTPFRRDDRGLEYLADQTEEFIVFMEKLTGKKMDWDKVKEYMGYANKTFEYQIKCANLRKHKPCPLPGRFLILNGTTNSLAADPSMGTLLEKEYEMGQMLVELGVSPCPEGEKHRAVFLQNMLWSSAGTMDWLEKKYNTVVTMDCFGFQHGEFFEHMDDRRDCLKVMGKKQQNNPMIHGASGPSEHFISMADGIIKEYEPDVSIFMGHVGCKHTWASAKMVTDMIQEKYGLPTLYVDVDSIDTRYKSAEEAQAEVATFMDTVVNKA